MKLPYDYTRCLGKNCEKREKCARYVLRKDCGPRTQFMFRVCDVGVGNSGFIPCEP